MALTLFKILAKRLKEAYTVETIIKFLREIDLHQIRGKGYIPLFKRTALTDLLQPTFGYHLSTKIVDLDIMKKSEKISR